MKTENTLTMELNDCMVKPMIEALDIEIEVMQGESVKMENGQTRITVSVSDEKYERFKEFIRHIMSLPTDEVSVKINGLKVHKN